MYIVKNIFFPTKQMCSVELYVKGTTFMLWEEKTWEIVIGGPCVHICW